MDNHNLENIFLCKKIFFTIVDSSIVFLRMNKIIVSTGFTGISQARNKNRLSFNDHMFAFELLKFALLILSYKGEGL